ncbi:MAG: quinone oxidoreductase [Micrococcales bacterium]|nr:quinone oxidoreductase [Micrococcales bacterium]
MRAIVAASAGGPEVLELRSLPDPEPGPDQVLVKVAAAGVNFIDTYRRSGQYPMDFPHVVGCEGAGKVVAVGDQVESLSVGDRVAWAQSAGSYAQLQVVDAAHAVRVPGTIDDRTAAATMLQGLTAHYLATSTVSLGPSHVVLVHAGAGGTGLLLTQIATIRGARVIATVSTAEKEALARDAGADRVIRYTELDDMATDLPAMVRAYTGRGVDVVYDGVGAATFDGSLASLRPRGTLVLFGASSGQVAPVDPQRLNAAGSVYLTRPSLGAYTATREELTTRTTDLFSLVAGGPLKIRIGATYSLAKAAEAHRALEGRTTTGKVLVIP